MAQKDTSDHERPEPPAATARNRPVTILVVDNEEKVLRETRRLLGVFRFTVVTAKSTAQTLQVIGSTQIDLALIDWRLNHENGMALGRALRRDYGVPFLLFSGYLDIDSTGHAYRGGAADVVAKPLRPGRLITAVNRALQHRRAVVSDDPTVSAIPGGADSVSQRWAKLILRAIRAEKDPNTESAIAEAGNVSMSVYRRHCAACGVSARHTRDLVRFLRANSRSQEDGSTLQSHLSFGDLRTRDELFRRAGLPVDSGFVPIRRLLLSQHFVPTTKECLRELAHMAANDPLFFVELESSEALGNDESIGGASGPRRRA